MVFNLKHIKVSSIRAEILLDTKILFDIQNCSNLKNYENISLAYKGVQTRQISHAVHTNFGEIPVVTNYDH